MRSSLPILLFLGACFGSPSPDAATPAPAALVATAEAQAGSLNDRWTVPGDVRALDHAELAAGAGGPVVEITVREGDRVQAGDRLLRVDSAPASARAASLRAIADETEVSLDRARRDLARLERVGDAVLSAAEVDAARSEVAMLLARLASQNAAAREASVLRARHDVIAPFNGVVSARMVDRGDWVVMGQRVLDLVSIDGVDVRVDAARGLAEQVSPGDPVRLGEVSGTVAAVVPSLDASTRTSVIRLAPDPGSVGLVPGSTVTVGFDVQRRSDEGALVPRDALVLGPVDTKVVRMAEGHAEIIVVQVLATTSDQALVTGVKPGDQVVTRGAERLRPGQALRVGETP